jgi:hypothetical protein
MEYKENDRSHYIKKKEAEEVAEKASENRWPEGTKENKKSEAPF